LTVLPHILIVATAVVVFALLFHRAELWRASDQASRTSVIIVASLTSINIAGALGLAWFATVMLFYDGIMIIELGICVGLMVALAITTTCGFMLSRHGRERAALALLALAAVPTILVYAFLIYLDGHPIDMR
jgi:hypothetical protein